MSVVTLSPNYVRKLAESYKQLRSNQDADPKVLQTVKSAAERCIAAHMRAELRLTEDVKLPLGTVLMMLQYVQRASAERLEPVPMPEDFAPPVSSELRPFLTRAMDRLRQAVAA